MRILSLVWFILFLSLPSASALAENQEAAVVIKQTAPKVYVVKEGDTLWQIAGKYLDKPWNWPLLWQKNEHIHNPHLIFPGDRIVLVEHADGSRSVNLERTAKRSVTLSPKAHKELKNPTPIPTISWPLIETHIRNDLVMEADTYNAQPHLLGDQNGAVRFAQTDVVLGTKGGFTTENFQIVRLHNELFSRSGESLGVLVKHIASAKLIPADLQDEILVHITQASAEIKRGDRLLPLENGRVSETLEMQAATTQTGEIILSLKDRALMGKYDTVVLDMGLADVKRGTVMGIYLQGPDIINIEPPTYASDTTYLNSAFAGSDRIKQPALKVGELVIFNVFEKVSYGLITSSTNVIRTGAIVAKP